MHLTRYQLTETNETDDPMPQLKPTELDAVYTHFCKTMTRVGEPTSPLFLARFALLAMERIGDAAVIDALISAAAENVIG